MKNHSFAVVLHILLSPDRDGKSGTSLDPTWVVINLTLYPSIVHRCRRSL